MPPQFSCVPLRSTSENCAVLPCFSDSGCFPTAHFLTFPCAEFIGTPTELSERIDPVGTECITPKKVSRLILQNLDALSKIGISGMVRRSNGKRLIELRRAESDDAHGTPAVDPVDPVGALCGGLREDSECGE